MKAYDVLSIVRVVLCLSFGCLNCTNNPVTPISPEMLKFLELHVVEGSILANLMPSIPPDPIVSRITIVANNRSTLDTMNGLKVLAADVYVASNDSLLGRMTFTSAWDGRLSPGERDTVIANKVRSDTTLFHPTCRDLVYLTIFVGSDIEHSKSITSDTLQFGCVY